MRLIDADLLLAQMKGWHERLDEEAIMTGNRAICFTWHDAVTLIKHAPTVDAVPVIRCKDCKYWNGSGKFCDYEMSGLENDFCSWAERKEE